MSMKANKTDLGNGITGIAIGAEQFKTKRISVNFLLPLTEESSTAAAILAQLLTHSTKAYPSQVLLRKQMQWLYGAKFNGNTTKMGDVQILTLAVTVVDDKYALNKEAISTAATDLLCDALLEPNLTDGFFSAENTAICKRLQIEALESIINNKRRYVISRATQITCPDEPFGIEIGGTVESVNALTAETLVNTWKTMLTDAPMIVVVSGSGEAQPVFDRIAQKMSTIRREPKDVSVPFIYRHPKEIKRVEEEEAVSQGKLVMTFRSTISSLEQNDAAFRVMTDVFGGGPYSRLFTVVREKMSLCYYCAAGTNYLKGITFVDCGVSNENIEPARLGILEQLHTLQQNEPDEELLAASKMSFIDSIRSVEDSLESMEHWYLLRWFNRGNDDPEEMIRQIEAVTPADVTAAANTLTPDTVFILKAKEDAHE